MLGGNDQISGAVQRIGTRCIDAENIILGLARKSICLPTTLKRSIFGCRTRKEIDLGTGTAADPVTLQQFDALRPVKSVEPLF